MRNIPDDIADTAALICASVGIADSHARKVLAAAILAERKRCSDVAEGFRQAHDTGSGFDSQPARATAEAIRDAILT
ncbi:hypothetical protein [Shinella sp. BYT-45]|uniref:hypothetical protein n=1 Tax=Shinella sp. BYT-45 TaxID=3377377 RepID=UPI003980EEEB